MNKIIILFTLLTFYAKGELRNISDNIPPVKYIKNFENLNLQVLSSGLMVNEDFLNINYEISYDFYVSNGSIPL